MFKYLLTTCIIAFGGFGALAQSITVGQLVKELGAPFNTVTAHLQARGFNISGSGQLNNAATIRFQKKLGDGIENVAIFAGDTARKIPAGITFTYNKKSYTNGLIGDMKRTGFALKRTINEPKRTIAIYQDAKYEAGITTYHDANAYTSVTVRPRTDHPER
ncbi:hypothetical protein [Mucilaginibacter myungsuensis]|uniref:Uncharacterized protein n=1 Tax=Mucilaginibacter myungsuensis TaxID=649104 RepID=A0A929KYA6_9SPHI|nr:hypothetical protein [Mucilaginibacter myungsuensis]MBE9661124.1 hypothetical protein [Mucilaginibacter myungsuensis]MDN3597269.1 hypothetical protein [Mucilaginibacter myungsuensis]